MEIVEVPLSADNQQPLANTTVGACVARAGKDRLWEERCMAVDTVVVHYISAVEIDPSHPYERDALLGIFCTYGVSSHYLVERTGAVVRLVPETARAWHCGGSLMPEPDNRESVNDFSIGIELVGTHESGFTDEQYGALVGLCRAIRQRWSPRMRIVGHEHVAGARAVARGLRSEAKSDPGPQFDWSRLAHELGHQAQLAVCGVQFA